MDTEVELTDNKLYKYKSYTATKLKTHLYGKRHPTNTISKRVSFNLIFPIIPIGYNGLKGYIF